MGHDIQNKGLAQSLVMDTDSLHGVTETDIVTFLLDSRVEKFGGLHREIVECTTKTT